MTLEHELRLKNPLSLLPHELLLSIYYTASRLRKRAGDFLRPFGLTDVQFNLMMLLRYQSGEEQGLNQSQLSRMMLVNRANITSLIDRMEKSGLVERNHISDDRRYKIIKLTGRGQKLLEKVQPLYQEQVKRITSALTPSQQQALKEILEKIRANLSTRN